MKTLQRPNLGMIEVDIISDSSLILHPAASTPNALIKLDGKIGKPPGFKYTVEEIHKMIIQFATTNATVNIASQGGATTAYPYEVATELLSKSPVATGAGGRTTTRSGGQYTRMRVVVWGCNDVSGGQKKRTKPLTQAMLDNAAKFRGVLERYSCGIIIGPGEAKQWNYNETWSDIALQMRDAFHRAVP